MYTAGCFELVRDSGKHKRILEKVQMKCTIFGMQCKISKKATPMIVPPLAPVLLISEAV